jgi:hypothetical protein
MTNYRFVPSTNSICMFVSLRPLLELPHSGGTWTPGYNAAAVGCARYSPCPGGELWKNAIAENIHHPRSHLDIAAWTAALWTTSPPTVPIAAQFQELVQQRM